MTGKQKTLNDFIQDESNDSLDDKVYDLRERLDEALSRNRSLNRQLLATTSSLELVEEEFDKLVSVVKPGSVPKWLRKKRRNKKHAATPFLMLSDLHLDEIVDAGEMMGMNAYSRLIAESRFENVIDGACGMADNFFQNLEWDGIVCALGGDIVTGVIHEELAETNEATVPETIIHWAPILASGLKRLAETYGKVHVPCVDGNHDRFHKKIRAKKRAVSSMAWIIYNVVAMLCKDDERITFSITTSSEQLVDVYDTTFLLNHGDNFRSQGGIGGIYPSMLKWVGRKRNVLEFDIAVMGHWHQLTWDTNAFVNGSLKGYDEYAKSKGFGWERPQQMFFVVTPENGVTFQTAIYANKQTKPTEPDSGEGWSGKK